MIGVEFVESKKSRKPLAKELFQGVWNETKNRGVLFGNGGMHGNVCATLPDIIGEILIFVFVQSSDSSNKAAHVHQ